MRLTIVILIASFMQVSAASYGQLISINKNHVPLKEVLREIREQSGFNIYYDPAAISDAAPVSLKVEGVTVDEALKQTLSGLPLTYELRNGNIVIRKKEEPSFLERVIARFQAIDVKGRVVDSLGNGLAGATVSLKSGKGSTSTDAAGNFLLKNVDEGAVLVVSYLGYVTREVAVSKEPVLVALKESKSKLDEVQIQAFGVTTRRFSTGDITSVKADEIARQPVANPILALQGRVPGLMVTPASGLPEAAVTLQIRGQNSLSGKFTEPLIVIDGIPYANNIPGEYAGGNDDASLSALHFINPSDIASIDVLKDADATAIYGSRGANGVILITTKKGKAGPAQIDINANSGFTQRGNKKLQLLNTRQYLQMRKEAYQNDGQALPTSPAFNNYDLTVWDQNRYTDWQDVIAGGTGRFSSAQASISGGTETIQYLISGTYNGQTSIFPGHAEDQSGTGHFSLMGFSPDKKLHATLTGSYTANSSQSPDFTTQSIFLPPNAPAVYKPNGELNWEPDPNTGFASWPNPFAMLSNIASSHTNTLAASTDISYELVPGLVLKTTAGFSRLQLKSFAPVTLASQDPATWSFATASASRNNNESNSWSIEPQINYKTNIFKGRLDLLAGGSLQSQSLDVEQIDTYGYTSDALLKSLNAAGGSYALNGSSDYKYSGIFGRATYNWNEKYIVNLNARRDGSSRFGPGNQFGNFASLGAAWVFTNEPFVQKSLPFLSFGKLRFSYGNSGNDGIGDYQYIELYNYIGGSNGSYQGINTLETRGAVNSNYHWENTRKMEIGLDGGLFKDRIVFSAAYYQNRSSDQLGSYQLPSTAGNYTVVINQQAEIQNTGAEFTLSSTNIKTKNFSWQTSANISFTRNKLLKLPAEFNAGYTYGYDNPFEGVGKPFAGFVPVYDLRGVDPATGHYLFADRQGNTTSQAGAAYAYARRITTTPLYYGGVSNTLSYKGLSLDVFLQFARQMGRNYLFSSIFQRPGLFQNVSYGTGNMPLEVFEHRWQKPGDIAAFQRFSQNSSIRDYWNMARNSDAAWVDASFIKVRNVSLSYTIPGAWKQKWHVRNLRMYVNAQNPFTFTGYKGADPETQTVQAISQMRVITAGFQIGL